VNLENSEISRWHLNRKLAFAAWLVFVLSLPLLYFVDGNQLIYGWSKFLLIGRIGVLIKTTVLQKGIFWSFAHPAWVLRNPRFLVYVQFLILSVADVMMVFLPSILKMSARKPYVYGYISRLALGAFFLSLGFIISLFFIAPSLSWKDVGFGYVLETLSFLFLFLSVRENKAKQES
jgi:hypothetical protein